MSDEEIKNYVTTQPPREAAQRMIDEVNRRGGFDNITVLIAKTQQTQVMPARSGLPVVRLVGALAVLLTVGLVAVWAWSFVNSRFLSGSSGQVAQAVTTVTPPEVEVTPQPTRPGQPVPSPTTGTQTAKPTPERTPPTATLRPSPSTHAASPTTTPTTPIPKSITPATSQQTGKYPAPELISPKAGDSIIGPATFEWAWAGSLKPNESFDLRVWRLDRPETSVGQTREMTHRMERPPDGAGKYQWRVVVIQKRLTDDQIIGVSEMPAPIVLDFWRGRGPAGSSPSVTATAPPHYTPPPGGNNG